MIGIGSEINNVYDDLNVLNDPTFGSFAAWVGSATEINYRLNLTKCVDISRNLIVSLI